MQPTHASLLQLYANQLTALNSSSTIATLGCMHPATAHLLLGRVHVLHNKKDQHFTTALKLGLNSGQLFLLVLADINILHLVCLQQGCSSSTCVWFRQEQVKQNSLNHALLLYASCSCMTRSPYKPYGMQHTAV